MAVVWAHCKTKMVCEPDEPKEEGDGAENEEPEVKKGHGGCGHIQPQIRKEGLKLFVQYKKPKDDDEVSSSPVTPSKHLVTRWACRR
jgi:DNA-directed RNA polymerase II subunit RPB1